MSSTNNKLEDPNKNKSGHKIHIHRGLTKWEMKFFFYPFCLFAAIAITAVYGFFVYQLNELEKKPSITCVTGTCSQPHPGGGNAAVTGGVDKGDGVLRSGPFRARTD